jgi:5-methyltetrahydropteroyltriglutamate--homocysteine methyltransferase
LPRRSFTRAALAIGPQCGFASTVAGNPLSEADERTKLSLCVQTARAAWN